MPSLDSVTQAPAASGTSPVRGHWPSRLRLLLYCLCGLILLALLAAAAGVLWLRAAEKAALPVLDGNLRLTGLSAAVIVRRDAHGVPHIDAETLDDLWVAQGYVTAQDRLWQMDLFRRSASGELAEILGSSMLEHDKAQRVLQYRQVAERIYASQPAPDRARLDAYARGVNQYIAQHGEALPAEFRALHYKPRPWTGEDCIRAGLMLMALDMHWDVKLSRERIGARLDNPKLEADLYPTGSWRDHPPTGVKVDLSQPHPVPPPTSDDEEDDDRTEAGTTPEVRRSSGSPTHSAKTAEWMGHPDTVDGAALRAALGLPECDGCAAGSNNWVIAGKHTASGKPLLANDMHLGLMAPDIWYMADLHGPGYHTAGVTLPGVPGVIAGHNEHVAWGFTALYADVQDLYIEKLQGNNYEANDESWHPLGVDHEVIHVRGGKDVLVDVRFTDHGPLLNPLLPKETRAIALKWTLYDPKLNALPIFEMNTAANWTEFEAALSRWCWPTQNVVYADDQGHIAYQAVGRAPGRRATTNGIPYQHDTMDLRAEWDGYIPFEQMPHAIDPPSGFLATANSRVTSDQFPAPLTLEWSSPYRVERIYKMLDGRDGLKPADMLAAQTDVYSEVNQELGHRFAYAIDHTPGADKQLRRAADLMRSWDGRLTADSAAASIVTQTRKALWPLILEPKLGKDWKSYHWAESDFAEEEIVMHSSADWLPAAYKSWDALLTDAVRRGMDEGKAPGDVARWSYGSWHTIDVEHPVFGLLPLVRRMAGTGRQPLSGDHTTVKQVDHAFGPSQRFTMDWSDVDGSTENIVMGESGDPLSPYFRDQWKDWYGGTTFALPFSRAAVAAQTRHTLRLMP